MIVTNIIILILKQFSMFFHSFKKKKHVYSFYNMMILCSMKQDMIIVWCTKFIQLMSQ